MEFAQAVVRGDSAHAHGLLSPALQAALTPEKLAADYQQMIEYGEGPPDVIKVMTTLDDWADRQLADTEWVYVAMANDTYSEAVTVVVAQEGSRLVIRSIEWGRP